MHVPQDTMIRDMCIGRVVLAIKPCSVIPDTGKTAGGIGDAKRSGHSELNFGLTTCSDCHCAIDETVTPLALRSQLDQTEGQDCRLYVAFCNSESMRQVCCALSSRFVGCLCGVLVMRAKATLWLSCYKC